MVVGMRARGISGQRYLVADAEAERDKGKVNGVRTAETERINPCINEGSSYQQKEKKKKILYCLPAWAAEMRKNVTLSFTHPPPNLETPAGGRPANHEWGISPPCRLKTRRAEHRPPTMTLRAFPQTNSCLARKTLGFSLTCFRSAQLQQPIYAWKRRLALKPITRRV